MKHRVDERAPHPRELVFPGAAFPGASEVIHDAYQAFWSKSGLSLAEIMTQEHELNLTSTLLSDFCEQYISVGSHTAAMLSPVIDALVSEKNSIHAYDVLRIYANNTLESEDRKRFVVGLLIDRPVIADFWRTNVMNQYPADSELQNVLRGDKISNVSIEQWGEHARAIEPKDINKLITSVNIQSLLIKAAELLAQLDPSTATNDSQTLVRTHQAEVLFAPFCEIIGFDAFAMALYSRVHTLRAMFTGNLAPLQRAQDIINERGSKEQVDADAQELFAVIFGDNIHEQIINHNANHGVMVGEGLCTSEYLRLNWRLKSVGSLTKKLDSRLPEMLPLDILGVTVTTRDIPQIASRLKRILERASSDERVTLTPTSARTAAVHVKGTANYIETIRQGLGFESLDAMRQVVDVLEVNEDSHHVCKVTLVFAQPGRPDLRAEIQITTEKDRIENRIGKAAHILYKLVKHLGPAAAEIIDKEDYTQQLALIHARKDYLGSSNEDQLTSGSLLRADAFYKELTGPVDYTPYL